MIGIHTNTKAHTYIYIKTILWIKNPVPIYCRFIVNILQRFPNILSAILVIDRLPRVISDTNLHYISVARLHVEQLEAVIQLPNIPS